MLRCTTELTRRLKSAARMSIKRTTTRLRGLMSPRMSRINEVAREGVTWAKSSTGGEARNAAFRSQAGCEEVGEPYDVRFGWNGSPQYTRHTVLQTDSPDRFRGRHGFVAA